MNRHAADILRVADGRMASNALNAVQEANRGRQREVTFTAGSAEVGGKRGRGGERKEIVVIAVEVKSPKGFGRVRMRRVRDVSGASLVPFVSDVAEKGSEILTDGWKGYNYLSKRGYQHQRTVLSSSGDPAHVSMPGVHRIAALLKWRYWGQTECG